MLTQEPSNIRQQVVAVVEINYNADIHFSIELFDDIAESDADLEKLQN